MVGRSDAGSGEAADDSEAGKRADRSGQVRATVNTFRSRLAQAIWIVCVLAALVLAIGALCIALKANASNGLVKFFVDTADKLDFGVFSRQDGVFHWKGQSHSAMTKNALVNWGLAAVVWLIGGRILERIVRP